MNIPAQIMKNCIKCKTHTLHDLNKISKRPRSAMCWGNRQELRAGKRGNIGRFSKSPAERVKTSRKPHILQTCTLCAAHSNYIGRRTKKYEIVKVGQTKTK